MRTLTKLRIGTVVVLSSVIMSGVNASQFFGGMRVLAQDDRPLLIFDHEPAGEPRTEKLANGSYREIYRNKRGEIFLEKEFNGLGILVKTREISTVFPNAQAASVTVTHYGVANGVAGAVVKREEITYDKTGTMIKEITFADYDKQGIPQTKTERENGKTRTFKRAEIEIPFQDPWVPASPNSSQSSSRKSIPTTTAPGYAVATTSANGLNTISFTTPNGKINVNLADDLSVGDTFTGTVIDQPTGKTENDRAQSQAELNGYVVEIEEKKTRVSEKTFTRDIPATLNDTARTISLWFKGKKVATCGIPIGETPQPKPTSHQIQTGGQQGSTIKYQGDCNGRPAPNDYVKLHDRILELLAESPRQKIVRNDSESIGPDKIECWENGVHTECDFRNIRVRLTAPKTNLIRGEETELTMIVDGLLGLDEDLPWVLIDSTPSVLIIKEGNLQMGTIHPAEVDAIGIYVRRFTLQGIEPGPFSITATVTWPNYCPGLQKQAQNESPGFANLLPGIIARRGFASCLSTESALSCFAQPSR